MKYIKAKYIKHGVPTGASYNFKSEDESINVGDTVTTGGNVKMLVTDIVDDSFAKAYGEDKVKSVVKVVEPVQAESEDK